MDPREWLARMADHIPDTGKHRTHYLTDEVSIKRILDELGVSPPQVERPPPVREVVRVPVDEEGREFGIA